MTDERLRPSMPDDQVCPTCQAVVMNMGTHVAWHDNLVAAVTQRITGLERRLTQKTTALQDQAGNYLGDHGGRLEQVESALGRLEAALPHFLYDVIYERLRGVEDELTKREVHDVLNSMNEEDRHTYDDERDDPDEGHVIVNMAGETVATVEVHGQ